MGMLCCNTSESKYTDTSIVILVQEGVKILGGLLGPRTVRVSGMADIE